MSRLDEDAVRSFRDREQRTLREGLISKGGLSPREAERKAAEVMRKATDDLQRRRG